MLYSLSKIIWIILTPINFLIIFFLLYFFFKKIKYEILSKIFLLFIFVLFIVIAILPTGKYLLVKLETKHPHIISLPEHVDGILILGGPSDSSLTRRYNQVSFNAHGERLTESIKLFKKYKSARIIFTGGSGIYTDFNNSHAYVAKKFFDEMNISSNNITYEFKSRNTYENFTNSIIIAKPKNNEIWLLVTSAFHMPRANNIAKKLNWNFIPYPVDFQTIGKSTKYKINIFKILENINMFNFATHEWVGLISYYILDRTKKIY